ncbi:MAG: trigger factor [bacterium]|nr:trigger factor [bacterium]
MSIPFEISTNKVDDTTIEMVVTIPSQEYDNRFHTLLRDTAKSIQLHGFRPGKVPYSILKQRIGSKIEEEVVNEITKEVYWAALEKAEIQPVTLGTIENLVYGLGQNMQFVAKVPILPDVEIKGLDGFTTWRYKPTIQEQDVQEALMELQQNHAKYIVSDLPARENSFLECKIVRLDEHQNPIKSEPAYFDHLPVKGNPLGPNSTEQFIGLTAGDTKVIKVVEEHFHGEEKHEHQNHYQVAVISVKEQILPELNDEFARSISAVYDTLEELKLTLKENLEKSAQAKSEEGVYKRVVEKLMSENQFVVSKQLIDEKLRHSLAEFGENVSKLSKEFVQKYLEPKAVQEAKWEFIIRKLIKSWDIQISDEDVDNDISIFAKNTQQRFEDLKDQLIRENRYESVRIELAKKTAMKRILESIHIEEREIPFSEFKTLQEM